MGGFTADPRRNMSCKLVAMFNESVDKESGLHVISYDAAIGDNVSLCDVDLETILQSSMSEEESLANVQQIETDNQSIIAELNNIMAQIEERKVTILRSEKLVLNH
jgi:hypothetical protein